MGSPNALLWHHSGNEKFENEICCLSRHCNCVRFLGILRNHAVHLTFASYLSSLTIQHQKRPRYLVASSPTLSYSNRSFDFRSRKCRKAITLSVDFDGIAAFLSNRSAHLFASLSSQETSSFGSHLLVHFVANFSSRKLIGYVSQCPQKREPAWWMFATSPTVSKILKLTIKTFVVIVQFLHYCTDVLYYLRLFVRWLLYPSSSFQMRDMDEEKITPIVSYKTCNTFFGCPLTRRLLPNRW